MVEAFSLALSTGEGYQLRDVACGLGQRTYLPILVELRLEVLVYPGEEGWYHNDNANKQTKKGQSEGAHTEAVYACEYDRERFEPDVQKS